MATSLARTVLTNSWRRSSAGNLSKLPTLASASLSVVRRNISSGALVTRRTPTLLSASIRPLRWGQATISTSEKNKDAASVTVTEKSHRAADTKATESLEDKEENWISYGYSLVDRDEDEWVHHALMFFTITLAICWGTLFVAYYPDFKDHAWAQREAYLELERREKAGLPLIDPNMIDPANIYLPSEEELADFEIVI